MVVGLTALVAGASSSFVPEPVYSPYIIIQPIELLHATLASSNTSHNGAYGVDFLRSKLLLDEALKKIIELGLKPICILNGFDLDAHAKSSKASLDNFRAEKYSKSVNYDVPASKFETDYECTPCFRQMIFDSLRSANVLYARLSYGNLSGCLGVSYILDCPIASMASDYFLVPPHTVFPKELQSVTINNLKFVYFSTTGFFSAFEKNEADLKLRVYHSELSPLAKVPASSRPLISLLLNPHVIRKLPASLDVCQTDSENYNSAKLRTVIDWVSETNPIRVLQAIMESLNNCELMNFISNKILLHLQKFCPDFVEASQVLKLLDLATHIPAVEAPKPNLKLTQQKQEPGASSPMAFFLASANLLKGAAPEDRPIDFLYRWPVALVYLYRFGMLNKLFLQSLYSSLGLLLAYTNKYLVEFPGVYGPSRILRYLHYCLIIGIEEANSLVSKLIGLRPHAKEICREDNFSFKTYSIYVRSMHLPPNCSADDFIFAFFDFKNTFSIPDWSIALILSCLLWHQQKEEHKDCDIAECPLILSTLVLAVATHYNLEADLSILADHYDGLKLKILTKLEKAGTSPTPATEKKLLHCAMELIMVYDHYISLYRLLTALQTENQKPDISSLVYHRFPPMHTTFPSLALLVYMASHLETEKTPSSVAMRLWLVNAFMPSNNDPNCVVKLQNAVSVFSTLLKFLPTVKLDFISPMIDIAAPPSRFIVPKMRQSQDMNVNHMNLRSCGAAELTAKTRSTFVRGGKKGSQSYAAKLSKRFENLRMT